MHRSGERDNTRDRSRHRERSPNRRGERRENRSRSRSREKESGEDRSRHRDRDTDRYRDRDRDRDRHSNSIHVHGAHGSTSASTNTFKAVPECDADPDNDCEWETFCGTEVGSKLVQCCHEGNIEEVTRLLDERPERLHEPERQLSFCCENDYIELTPLHAAVASKRRAVAKLLVERGVDVNLRSRHFSNTALDVAINNGAYNLVKVLVGSGAETGAGAVLDVTSPHLITHLTPAQALLTPAVDYLVKGRKLSELTCCPGSGSSWARCVDILTLLLKSDCGCLLQPREEELARQVVGALQNYDEHAHAQVVDAENKGLHPTSSRIVKHVSGKEARKLGQALLKALSLDSN